MGIAFSPAAFEPGAGLDDADPLAATDQLRGRLVGRRTEIHPLWRSDDRVGERHAARVHAGADARRKRGTATIPIRQSPFALRRNFVSDGGVIYTFTGVALTSVGSGNPAGKGEYGISPAGPTSSICGDQGAPVTITFTQNVPVSYVPNMTPVYNLTDLDFVDEKGNKDPVQVSRPIPSACRRSSASNACRAPINTARRPSRRAINRRLNFTAFASARRSRRTRFATRS